MVTVAPAFSSIANRKITICMNNSPDSIGDLTLTDWGVLNHIFNDVYEQVGGKCSMYSAFTAQNYPFVVRTSKNHVTSSHSNELLLNIEEVALQQAAEWGMRAIQSPYINKHIV